MRFVAEQLHFLNIQPDKYSRQYSSISLLSKCKKFVQDKVNATELENQQINSRNELENKIILKRNILIQENNKNNWRNYVQNISK